MNLCCLCVRSTTPFFVENRGRGGGHREARRNLRVLRSEAPEGDLNKRVLADEGAETETATPESKV